MSVQTTIATSIRPRRRWPLVMPAAALAGGVTAVVLALAPGSGTERADQATPSRASILSSLDPDSRRYVEGISEMSQAQLAAAFGTGPVERPAASRGR
jgi:hypothetical protein